jgi:hypothetical protein
VERINWPRVFIGGLTAGVILCLGEYVFHEFVLGARVQEAMSEMGLEKPTGSDIGIFVGMTLLLGILLVWLYAAIRPRYGPGPRAAIVAGFFVWVILYAFWYAYNLAWEIFPGDLIVSSTIWGFFALPIATVVGAWLYRE